MAAGKCILVHHGALGDFCLAWPAMAALVQEAASRGVPSYWAGAARFSPFVEPLGVLPCPPALKKAAEACYAAETLPHALQDARLYWFGLEHAPFPEPILASPQVLFFPLVQGDAHPAESLAKDLNRLGVSPVAHAAQAFQRLFGRWSPSRNAPILLLPGAGHRSKRWPAEQFTMLAGQLADAGHRVAFVLGPDEREQGVRMARYPVITPEPLLDLCKALRDSGGIVGNDSGPLHMAGLLGVPGVALFGPTNEAQWGPLGMRHLTAAYPCRPCSRTTKDLTCKTPGCLEAISVAAVREAVLEAIAASTSG